MPRGVLNLLHLFAVVLCLRTCGATSDGASASADPPADGFALLAAGDTAVGKSEYNVAVRMYSAAIAAFGDVPAVAFTKRAAAHLQLRQTALALKDLNAAVDRDGAFVQGRLHRASLLRRMCSYAAAEADLAAVLALRPGQNTATTELAVVTRAAAALAAARVAGGAAAELAAVLDLSPDCTEARLLRAQHALMSGDAAGAIAESGRILKADPASVDALVLRARAYYVGMGDLDLALRHVREALRYDPEHGDAKRLFRTIKEVDKHEKSGAAALATTRLKDATDEYMAALAADPTAGVVAGRLHLSLCRVHKRRKQGAAAITACTAAAAAAPESAEPLVLRGEAHLLVDDLAAAQADVRAALQIDQHDGGAQELHHRVEKLLKMASRKDLYKVLGVTREASLPEIKKAYRRLSLVWHPDKHAEDKDKAVTKFQEIAHAYEVLGEEESRTRYDAGEDPDQPQQQQQHHGFHGHPFHGHPGFGGGGGGQTFSFKFG